MNQNIFCNPKLLIRGKEIQSISNATFSDSGNNTLQKLSATFNEPELEDLNLFNEKVEFYLNSGSDDSTPLFRGFIKEFTSSSNKLSISAMDPRIFISGKDALPIVIDDKNNYDGYTVIQFITDVLENNLNSNTIILSTEALKEMDKPIYMTDERRVSSPYDLIKEKIASQRDDDDILNIHEYFLNVQHGGLNTSLTLNKTRSLDSTPDLVYTYRNGIQKLQYKERAPPSFGIAQSKDGDSVRFDYGNAPKGNVGIQVSSEKELSSRAEAREAALVEVLLKQEENQEITLTVTKGYFLDLGSIIRIDVPDSNITGQYRITGKSINFSETNVTCSFNLNSRPIKVSDYI